MLQLSTLSLLPSEKCNLPVHKVYLTHNLKLLQEDYLYHYVFTFNLILEIETDRNIRFAHKSR